MFCIEADRGLSLTRDSTASGRTPIVVRFDKDNRLIDTATSAPTFIKNCLRSFKRNIEPTLPEYARRSEFCVKPIVIEPPPPTESAKVVTTIPKSTLCAVEGEVYKGKYYAFLMTHPLKGKKTSANVGYSTNPARDVYLHNHLLIPDRTTSAAAPHWQLNTVLGPFDSLEKARECAADWVDNSRGIESKENRGILLSHIYDVDRFSMHIEPEMPVEEYLAKFAPPIFLETYQKMLQQQSPLYQKQRTGGSGGKKPNKKKSIH